MINTQCFSTVFQTQSKRYHVVELLANFLFFVTLFGLFFTFLSPFAFASAAPSSPVRTPPYAIYDRFFACFLVNRAFVAISDSLVLAMSAVVCIAISALLHNCSMISCSRLPRLCDPLRSDSNIVAVCRCNCDIFYGVCKANGSFGELFGVDGCNSTLRFSNTIVGFKGSSLAPRNAP